MIDRPEESEFHPFYKEYISLVKGDVLVALEAQPKELTELARSVSPDQETFRYDPGKWTVREVLGHVTDGERVFGHRAFCIGRGEKASLPGFDENSYVAEGHFDERPLADLVGDFSILRESNLRMLRSLGPRGFERVGTANGNPVSVRAIAFIMAGHVLHHLGVLRSRYRIGRGA